MPVKKKKPKPCTAGGCSNDPEAYMSCGRPEFQHLICLICEGVYDDPVQCPSEHYFCKHCITNWLTRSQTCPIDRNVLQVRDLEPAPRILSDVINSLEIHCRYHCFGCQTGVAQKEPLPSHLAVCGYRWLPLRDHDYTGPGTTLYPVTGSSGQDVTRTPPVKTVRHNKFWKSKDRLRQGTADGKDYWLKFDPLSCFT